MQNGYVSPERTTLIASTHRIYATVEKMQMADGRFDSERVIDGRRAARQARGAVRHAQARAGERHGDQRGAVRRHGGQRRAAAAARGLRAGDPRAAGAAPRRACAASPPASTSPAGARRRPQPPAPPKRADGAAGDPATSASSGSRTTRASATPSSSRERMQALPATATPSSPPKSARHLALWMSYEDIIRVADLKTRASRFERVRKEVGAKDGEPVVVIDFLKPGVEEFASLLPHVPGKAAHRVGRAAAASSTPTTSACTSRPRACFGYLLVRSLAWLQALAAASATATREEQQLIERWLGARARGRGAQRAARAAKSPNARASSRATARRTAAARRTSSPSSTRWWRTRPTADPRRAGRRRSARRAKRRSPTPRARRSAARSASRWCG